MTLNPCARCSGSGTEPWQERVRKMLLCIPVEPHVNVEMSVPFPMTVAQWDRMMVVLAAMKPGIVSERTAGTDPGHAKERRPRPEAEAASLPTRSPG